MKAAAAKKSTPVKWHDAEDLRWGVRHWASRIGVQCPLIHLRKMSNKWASISTVGRLTLNLELLELPRGLGEFVIVHELVHLLAPNHGKVFKSFMLAYMPDWERREAALQVHAALQQSPGTSRRTPNPGSASVARGMAKRAKGSQAEPRPEPCKFL